MDSIILNLSNPVILLGALVVFMVAMCRFNKPQTLLTESSDNDFDWLAFLKQTLTWQSGKQNPLLRPPRANTTVFRFRLHQILYAVIAVVVYFLMLVPSIRSQFQGIIEWFVQSGLPDVSKADPLVISAFVVLILPNVPPFRWADITIRTKLYEHALIPAQQLREINRLKRAPYNPRADLIEQVRITAVAEGFHTSDIAYNSQFRTTQSLWCKCLLLIESINEWEADDHYKTAFAVLKEPDSDMRSVDVVKQMQLDLVADARVCFSELRQNSGVKSDEIAKREEVFRLSCRVLLTKIYSLLACISLHSHYSDVDRVEKFGDMGFHLEVEHNGPIPDSNDLLILAIIVSAVIVFPLAYKLGVVKAIMIGMIMLSAVLSPIVLARVCPRMCSGVLKRHGPNVMYPLMSGLLAAFIGFLVFYLGGQFLQPSSFCAFTGVERYTNCSYPWSFLHGGLAFLLAIRLGRGNYPDVSRLQGWQRYRQWGDFTDAIFCAVCMLCIAAFIVIPLLEPLRPNHPIEGMSYWMILGRMTVVSFILGFVVPTWYRAQKNTYDGRNRRGNLAKRERFSKEMDLIRHGGPRELT